MVVLRIIGDEWKFNEKLALSVPPSKSFLMCTTQLKEKLQIPSWTGCGLYYTEGKPPNYVRATVPVPMGSTPGKEGMKDGTLLYVKIRADQARQQLDREFQEALVAWRQSNGIEGVLSDGSDVFEFMDDFSSRLNPSTSRDINEHEEEKRVQIEGAEHRQFFVLTFEYREVQQLKDQEGDGRQSMQDDWHRAVLSLHRDSIVLPTLREKRQAALEQEGIERRSLCASEESQWSAMHRTWTAGRASILSAQAAKESTPSPLGQEAHDPSIVEMRRRLAAEGGVGGTVLLPSNLVERLDAMQADMKKETSEIRTIMTSLIKTQNDASAYLASAYDRVSTTLEAQHLQNIEAALQTTASMCARDASLPWFNEEEVLLKRKIELLRCLIEEETKELDDRRFALAKAEHLATRNIVATAVAAQDEVAALVELKVRELECLRQALHAAEEENRDLSKQLTLHRVVVEQQDRDLQAADAELSTFREKLHAGTPAWIELSINANRWENAVAANSNTAGLHADVFSICLQFVQRHASIPSTIYEGILGYPLGAIVRHPDPLGRDERLLHDDRIVRTSLVARHFFVELLQDVVLLSHACPHQVADEFCFRFEIRSHPLRQRFLRVLDDLHPHVSCVVDLLLDIFCGREAELMLFLEGRGEGRNAPSGASFVSCWDEGMRQRYYYHPDVDVTQWLEPSIDVEALF